MQRNDESSDAHSLKQPNPEVTKDGVKIIIKDMIIS
jgi:hypothetical protein